MHDATRRRRRERWGIGVIALHWGTAACVVVLVDTGWLLVTHAAHLGQRTPVLQLHASLGILLLAATVIRVVTRLLVTRPAVPESRLRRIGAQAVQFALYATLLALILTGIAAAAPRPFAPPVKLFGGWPLPKISGIPPSLNMRAIHAALTWLLFGLVGLHVAAAIYGTFFRSEQTILRMLPLWRRRGSWRRRREGLPRR